MPVLRQPRILVPRDSNDQATFVGPDAPCDPGFGRYEKLSCIQEESFQKALRGLETGVTGLNEKVHFPVFGFTSKPISLAKYNPARFFDGSIAT